MYFQAVKGASPIKSSVDFLPSALIVAPFALTCGIIVQITNKYRPVNAVGWIFTVVGFGLLSLLKVDSSIGKWAGFQVVAGIGTGLIVRIYVITLSWLYISRVYVRL